MKNKISNSNILEVEIEEFHIPDSDRKPVGELDGQIELTGLSCVNLCETLSTRDAKCCWTHQPTCTHSGC